MILLFAYLISQEIITEEKILNNREYIDRIAMQTELNTSSVTSSFLIPPNVWVIKITAPKIKISQDKICSVSIYNKKQNIDSNSTLEADKDELIQTKLLTFSSSQDHYYLVNPNASKFNNFITINTVSNYTDSKDFKISFITADDCLSSFNGKRPIEALEKIRDNSDYNKSITSLACLLIPSNIVDILGNLWFTDIDDFFKAIDENRNFYLQQVADKTITANVAITISELLDYISFYYTYELSKDVMKLAKTKGEDKMSDLDTLLSFKMFDATYIMRSLDIFYAEIEKVEEQSTSLKLIIEEDNKEKLHNMNNVLIQEFKKIEAMANKIPETNFLAKSRFSYLKETTSKLLSTFDIYQNIFTSLLNENNSENLNITYDLRRSVKELIYSFNNYDLIWNDLFVDKEEEAAIQKTYDAFMKGIRDIFGLNVLDLKERLNSYFLKNFEADLFRKTIVVTKNYTDPLEFINEFSTMLNNGRN